MSILFPGSDRTLTYQTLESSEKIECDLVWQEWVDDGGDGYPSRAPDEDLALAVDVGNAAPKQEEAAKGKIICRHHPLQPRIRNVQVPADCWQDNDNCLPRYSLQRWSVPKTITAPYNQGHYSHSEN